MDPPPCVQNAMMKQDKKPFTYTPGGIDLSEIKSPRLGRRIERNANYGGASDLLPQQPSAPRQPQDYSNLPPSTLVAMQPQMHVQVLPAGQVPTLPSKQAHHPPPPPPPPSHVPPPPPMQPLPTQKVVTSDNQVLERPDMTKIIPDDPMRLLRKTGGPKPRKGLVEQMYEAPQQQQPRSPPTQQQQQQWSPPTQQQQQQWSQPQQQWSQPQQQQWSPPVQQPPQRAPQMQQAIPEPTVYQPPASVQRNETLQRNDSQRQNEAKPKHFEPPIKVIERQPEAARSPPAQQQQQRQPEPPMKTSTAHLGHLYIPPVGAQQQNSTAPPSQPVQKQNSIRNPPQSAAAPQRQQTPEVQTPPTPTLNKAPKPWENKKQQEELPPWAKRDSPTTNGTAQHQAQPVPQVAQQAGPTPAPRWAAASPKSPPTGQQQQGNQPGQRVLRVNIITQDENNRPCSPRAVIYDPVTGTQNVAPVVLNNQGGQPNNSNPNVVYVNQPLVFQHPGGAAGGRGVPVTPKTPGNERTLHRQPSWGNNPTQSNSFKIIQKLTGTEDDDEDDDTPVTEHSPKFPQQFQQKMRVNDDDRNLMNKFKQGVDEGRFLHNETDPRYMGAAIPSKAFKMLQSMTGPPEPVPKTPPAGNNSPKVRTIPIQIEGEPQGKYIPPSEQTVPEPKKYTGSSIPSRSFKILQAMTAPDSCGPGQSDF